MVPDQRAAHPVQSCKLPLARREPHRNRTRLRVCPGERGAGQAAARGQHGDDLGGRVLASYRQPLAAAIFVVPLPLLEFRSTPAPARQPASPAAPNAPGLVRHCGQFKNRRERTADAASGFAPRRATGAVRFYQIDTLGPQCGHPQVDRRHHIGLEFSAGLGQQQIPFVVVGEQVSSTVDEPASFLTRQPGPADDRWRRRPSLRHSRCKNTSSVVADDHQPGLPMALTINVGKLDVTCLRYTPAELMHPGPGTDIGGSR